MDIIENYYGGTQNQSFFENFKTHIIDFIQTLVVFGAIFALIYLFVSQPHKVSGLSMFPTFNNGDYILTDKISYRFGTPKKGDIIVLKNPRNEEQDFIKRIVAVPGDTIKIESFSVIVNDQKLKEVYLVEGILTKPGNFIPEGNTLNVGPNQYFAFGDNRERSSDSRDWGPITKEEIVGKVFFRYWPLKTFGLTP